MALTDTLKGTSSVTVQVWDDIWKSREYLIMWGFSVFGALYLIFFYMNLLKTVEVASAQGDYCNGDTLEIESVRYQALLHISEKTNGLSTQLMFVFSLFAIGVFFTLFYMLQAFEYFPPSSKLQVMGVLGLVLVVAAAITLYCAIQMWTLEPSHPMRNAYLVSALASFRYVVMLIVTICLVQFGVMDHMRPIIVKNHQSRLNGFQTFFFGMIFLLNIYFMIAITMTIRQIQKPVNDYSSLLKATKDYLRQICAAGPNIYDVRRLPENFLDALVANYMTYHMSVMNREEVIREFNRMLASEFSWHNPLVYTSVNKYAHIIAITTPSTEPCETQLKKNNQNPADQSNRLYCLLMSLRPSTKLTEETGDAATYFRKVLNGPLWVGLIYLFLHLAAVYEKFGIHPVTPLLFLLFAIALGLIQYALTSFV